MSESKVVPLSVVERSLLNQLLFAQEGKLSVQRKILKILDILKVEDLPSAIDLASDEKFKEYREDMVDFEFSVDKLEHLCDLIENFGGFRGGNAKILIPLADKLVEIKDKKEVEEPAEEEASDE